MVVKRSSYVLKSILHFEEADERYLDNAEKTVEAEHKAKRDNKKNVACFEDGDAKEKTECS